MQYKPLVYIVQASHMQYKPLICGMGFSHTIQPPY